MRNQQPQQPLNKEKNEAKKKDAFQKEKRRKTKQGLNSLARVYNKEEIEDLFFDMLDEESI